MNERLLPAVHVLVAAALLAAAQGWAARKAASPLPRFERPVLEDYALRDVAMVACGLRRFGADLAFIEMLQYYASTDWSGDGHHHDGEPAPEAGVGEGSADLHPGVRLRAFPDLNRHIRRIGSLDPYFHYAYLFGAGALAFNLNRPDEAFDLLREGSGRDPSFWQYRLYAGAIAFRQNEQIGKVVPLLEEAMRYPDCPTMLMNILANIHRRAGNVRRAAAIYARIIETSRDEGYVAVARARLEELLRERPNL